MRKTPKYIRFSSFIARDLGVDEAILVQNIIFWISQNVQNGKNHFENRTWTYDSAADLSKYYGFWNQRKIARILTSLERKNVIIRSNFNRHRYDRTSWYSFTDQFILLLRENKLVRLNTTTEINTQSETRITPESEMEEQKMSNAITQSVSPIPDGNTNGKPDTNHRSDLPFSDAMIYLNTAWGTIVDTQDQIILGQLLDEYGIDAFTYAVDQAAQRGVKKIKYMKGILRNISLKKSAFGTNKATSSPSKTMKYKKGESAFIEYKCVSPHCGESTFFDRKILNDPELNIKTFICHKCGNKYSWKDINL